MTFNEESRFRVVGFGLLITGGALTLLLAGCGNSSGSSAGSPPGPTTGRPPAAGPTVTMHGLRISGGYVPQPASPDVAAAYLTIANSNGASDRLTKVVTSATKSVMAMNESDSGGVGSMTDLSTVEIPAHGTFRFVPNHAHLMLEHPTRLTAGDRVTMTLTFTRAGAVTIRLPVVPLGRTPRQAPSAYHSGGATSSMSPMSPMSSMSSSPGMNMPGISMPG